MALRTTNSSEDWTKVYQAFEQVNFSAYDFDTIKRALLEYVSIYFPEHFNDYVESSEFVALVESFAYVAEQLAYRVDMAAHENFITTAQRKQSILRLAKLISYKPTRNIPVRGLVKLTSVTTTENVIDSRGVNLSNVTIIWNDPNNPNWKEQFFLVMNRVLSSKFGQPQKTFQIGDVVMDLYSLRNETDKLQNGVLSYRAATSIDTYSMELVPTDVDANGPYEREPDLNAAFSLIYANDGIGDGSDYTGFLLFTKQGALQRVDTTFELRTPNRTVVLPNTNVNNTDVWVQEMNDEGEITARWKQVETIAEQNLVFNNVRDTRKKFEVDTRENDAITIRFGDDDFSEAPVGKFRFWLRESANADVVIPRSRVVNQGTSLTYRSVLDAAETLSFTFSLTTTLQNGAPSETIERLRQNAPATYYAQNRMVNGQDYNTFLLRDPTILRLKTVNRTFAGQPKYIDWNDASGQYENVKLFGDDAQLRYTIGLDSLSTSVTGQAIIDTVIEPLLSETAVINTLNYIVTSTPALAGVITAPRRRFIEDARAGTYTDADGNDVAVLSFGLTADGSLKEKTAMQGIIDRHWYGEPIEYIDAPYGFGTWARIVNPSIDPRDDSRIYAASVPRTIDGVNKYPPGDIGSGLQPIAEQEFFALRFNPYMLAVGGGSSPTIVTIDRPASAVAGEVWTVEVQTDGETLAVRSNRKGSLPNGRVGEPYNYDGVEVFTFSPTPLSAFEDGDAVVLDFGAAGAAVPRAFFAGSPFINLNGWWQVLGSSELPSFTNGVSSALHHDLMFSPLSTSGALYEHSWVIFLRKVRQQPTNKLIGFEVFWRDLKLVIHSDETKFWYNTAQQLIDNETKRRVYDQIRILRSNIDYLGNVLGRNQLYDVVGEVRTDIGTVEIHELNIMPSDFLQEDDSGDLIPDRLLQFENFAGRLDSSYEFYLLSTGEVLKGANRDLAAASMWTVGSFVDETRTYGRRQLADNQGEGLDFMWQHFTPYGNIIDPSVTNIHDTFVLTRGYYDQAIAYARGTSTIAPTPPTPLELRNSYGALLDNKMLSDTVVLHPGKLRFLFGDLAEPQLRAKFKVVRAQGATLTNERIKDEILAVINTFFEIDNWDFGDTFYATELISLIHQRLPADVASVVLVPVYGANSFGDLFTVESGHDEILQSAAKLSDIEIVDALTPATIRQR
jgi:hypothetical protein